jgi:hypothetical protein
MVGAMEDVVKRGRKKGLGCTLITQRPADLAKQVLTQCEMLVAMRLVHPLDIKAVMEWVNVHADKDTAAKMIESLPTLPIGTAWFWSPGWGDIFERVKIRPRSTFDSGATPKPGEKRIEPKEMAKIDLEALGEKIAQAAVRAKDRDPEHLKREIVRLTKELGILKSNAEHVKVDLVEPKLLQQHRDRLDEITAFLNEEKNKRAGIDEHLRRIGENLQGVSARIVQQLNADERKMGVIHPRQSGKTVSRTAMPAGRGASGQIGDKVVWKDPIQIFEQGKTKDVFLNVEAIPKGELAILTACAQNEPSGCTREQITVLTGYKRSSRDAYIQRLASSGLVHPRGNCIVATVAGIVALGKDYKPLPTGDELRDHWMKRLPEGEAKILAVLVKFHPQSIARDVIEHETGYKRSSRDAYLQRLRARQLVVDGPDGGVRASDILFS